MSADILQFQTLLSGIMEAVLKGAIYDITRLVEDSFLDEVMRSRREIKSLRESLQCSERRWREQERGVTEGDVGYRGAEEFGKERIQKAVEIQCDVEKRLEVKEAIMNQGPCLREELKATSSEVPMEAAAVRITRPHRMDKMPSDLEADAMEFICKEEDLKWASARNLEKSPGAHLNGGSCELHAGLREQVSKGHKGFSYSLNTDHSPTHFLSDTRSHLSKGETKPSESSSDNITEEINQTEAEVRTRRLRNKGFDHVICNIIEHHPAGEKALFDGVSVSGPAERCTDDHHASGPVDGDAENALRDPASIKEEVETHSAWSEEARSVTVHIQHTQLGGDRKIEVPVPFSFMVDAGGLQRLNLAELKVPTPQLKGEQQHRFRESSQSSESERAEQANSHPTKVTDSLPCNKSFRVSENRGSYRIVPSGEKPFSCLHCGKSFILLRNLKDHQRYHTGKKSYTCTQCGKGFVFMCHLKVHLKSHTGERPFTCTQCGKSFTYLCNLKSHEQYHTGEKPFSCLQCGKSFSHSSHLKRHQLVHSGGRQYSCNDCGKKFSTNGDLRRHHKTHAR